MLHVSLLSLVPYVLNQDTVSMNLHWKGASLHFTFSDILPVHITGKMSLVFYQL